MKMKIKLKRQKLNLISANCTRGQDKILSKQSEKRNKMVKTAIILRITYGKNRNRNRIRTANKSGRKAFIRHS